GPARLLRRGPVRGSRAGLGGGREGSGRDVGRAGRTHEQPPAHDRAARELRPRPARGPPEPRGRRVSARGRDLRRRVDRKLRRSLPRPLYHFGRSRYYDVRALAGRNPGRGRLLPDFLIIGTAKSGTTTLHGWVSEHPFVVPAVTKEVHFFDYEFYRGFDWYRSHFPLASAREEHVREHGRPFLTGEASPTYISHQWAPDRIAEALPDVKLIVAFRNPIDRAY